MLKNLRPTQLRPGMPRGKLKAEGHHGALVRGEFYAQSMPSRGGQRSGFAFAGSDVGRPWQRRQLLSPRTFAGSLLVSAAESDLDCEAVRGQLTPEGALSQH